jgi:hypothetical protein
VFDVIGVHGKGQQQLGRNQLLNDWAPALADGIEIARGRQPMPPKFDLAFYGDLFRTSSTASDARGASPGGSVSLDVDEVMFFAELSEEIAGDELDAVEPGREIRARLPLPLLRFARWLDERFGVAGRVLFFGDLVQVRRFQTDRRLREAVMARVRESVDRGGPKVLVGHSLGSVVAYEALCATPGHGVNTFVTIGSPLALRSLRARLADPNRDTLPPGIARWVNLRDPRDPVCLGGPLTAHWPDVVDVTVHNGDDPHGAQRYLNRKETGTEIAAALDFP